MADDNKKIKDLEQKLKEKTDIEIDLERKLAVVTEENFKLKENAASVKQDQEMRELMYRLVWTYFRMTTGGATKMETQKLWPRLKEFVGVERAEFLEAQWRKG